MESREIIIFNSQKKILNSKFITSFIYIYIYICMCVYVCMYVLSLNVYFERIVYIECIKLCTLFKKLYMFNVYKNIYKMYRIENLCTSNIQKCVNSLENCVRYIYKKLHIL